MIFSFLIGGDGEIFEGRGWSKVGAHAPNYNDKSIGICLIGSFMGTKIQISTFRH
jgi:N-acetylmuramoyl-L-alanine amidase